jgi:hypothetical protein
MNAVADAQLQGWLFAAFAAVVVPAALFFQFSKNAALKRQLWPPVMVAIGVGFLLFFGLSGGASDPAFFALATAMVVLIVAINIRAMKFCGKCGATVMNQNPFSKPKFCSKCGAELQ